MQSRVMLSAAACLCAALAAGCASTRSGVVTQKMTWASLEEAVAQYRLVAEGQTTVADLKEKYGFDADKVSMAQRIEDPTEIRAAIMGANPNVRYEDLTKNERACLDAKENAHAMNFPLKMTTERSEGNLFVEVLKFKKKRRETGMALNAWFCYDGKSNIVLYKRFRYGPIDNLREDTDPMPDYLFFLIPGLI